LLRREKRYVRNDDDEKISEVVADFCCSMILAGRLEAAKAKKE
jgi:hypothetical protein